MRTIRRFGWFVLILVGMWSTVPTGVLAQSSPSGKGVIPEDRTGNWISTTSVASYVGDYGTGDKTTITEIAETLKYRGTQGEIGLTIPYLFRRGGAVTPGESRQARTQTVPSDADGIGDLRLKGKYYAIEETDDAPGVDLTGQIKFPTASENDGLGTGRFDAGVGTELFKKIGSFLTFGEIGVLFRDRPSGSTIKTTRLDYAGGIGYPFTERFTAYVSLEGSTKTNTGAEPPLEAVLSGTYKITETVSTNVFLLAGLTDGSPDYGGGVGLTLRF